MKSQIKIADNSRDKQYFAQIPNMLKETLPFDELAVYVSMKMIAGELGSFWMSSRQFEKQIKMPRKRLLKCIDSLLEKGYVQLIGTHENSTKPSNEYSITDIWEKNILFCKNKDRSPKAPISTERSESFVEKDRSPKAPKEYLINTKEEINTKYSTNVEQPQAVTKTKKTGLKEKTKDPDPPEVNEMIGLFKDLNPSYQRLFGQKGQRDSTKRLLEQLGKEKLEILIKSIVKSREKEFCPVITTPYELEIKMAKYLLFIRKESIQKPMFAIMPNV